MREATPLRAESTHDARIWPAYEAWRRHYNTCRRCNVQEWYSPTQAALCATGARAFRRWRHAVMVPFRRKEAA